MADTAIYHCQQAAEKAVKGFLVLHDQDFEKTHNIRFLVTLAIPFESEFSSCLEAAKLLTPYSGMFRYPDEREVDWIAHPATTGLGPLGAPSPIRGCWQAFYCAIHHTPTPPPTPPTLQQAVHWIARLEGFLGRRGDGQPRVSVLWKGFQHLADLTTMYCIMRSPSPGSPNVGKD